MKKRVLISVTNDLTNDQRINRIATTLWEAGFDVQVIGRRYRDTPPLPDTPYDQHRMHLLFRSGKWFYAEYAFRLFWRLLFSKFDLLNANDLDTLLPNFLVAKLRGKGLIYDSHEYFTEVPELVDRPGTRKIWLRLEQWIFPKLKKAYTVNQSIAEIYRQKYGVEVGVIRNLPFRKAFPVESEKQPLTLIYQGALNIGRGVELMIASLKFLPGAHLIICGKGDIGLELEEMVKEEGLTDQIEFKGMIPFQELHEITRKAVLGFSLEEPMGENYRLALPNKLFDYIQCGVPVLVSDLPEMERIVRKYEVGIVLKEEERKPEVLAGKIREALSEKNWEGYFAACREASEELNWEAEKEKLVRIYRS